MTRTRYHGPVMIVGATSDIGRALARRFAEAGRPLHLVSRHLEETEATANDLGIRYRVPVQSHVLDVTDMAAAGQLLDTIMPKPAVVICVAGVMPPQETCAEQSAMAALTVQTNLTAAGWLMEEAARHLAARSDETAVIGISSVAGDRGRAKNYWYGASKAGFTAVLSGLRQKYARSGLHVMTVKPGFVRTRMTEEMALPAALTSAPEDLADLVYRKLMAGRHVVCDLRWRLIMAVIRLLPESLFRRLSF